MMDETSESRNVSNEKAEICNDAAQIVRNCSVHQVLHLQEDGSIDVPERRQLHLYHVYSCTEIDISVTVL